MPPKAMRKSPTKSEKALSGVRPEVLKPTIELAEQIYHQLA